MKNCFSYYYYKSKEIVKKEGFSTLIKKGIYKIKILIYATNKAIWFYRFLNNTIPQINIPNIKIVIASQSEFEAWLQQHQTKFPWIYVEQEVLATRNDPKIAFVAKVNDKIIGYLKVAVKNAYILDYDTHIKLPNDTAFIQDTFVLPEFRRRGIAKCIISKVIIYLKRHGYSKIFCHIPQWNIASIHTYTSLGFKPCGNIRFLRIFKWKIYTKNPEKLIKAIQ